MQNDKVMVVSLHLLTFDGTDTGFQKRSPNVQNVCWEYTHRVVHTFHMSSFLNSSPIPLCSLCIPRSYASNGYMINLVLKADLAQQATGRLLIENTEEALPDGARFLAGIDTLPDAGLLVVVDDRAGLLVVGRESLLESVGVVIASLDERLASNVIGHVGLWGVEDLVVRTTGCRVNETAGDSGNKELVVNTELNGVLKSLLPWCKHLVKTLGLSNSTGETIKNESAHVSSAHLQCLFRGRETYPFLHSLLFSSSFLIMPIMISSLTRPPWSIIFLA